VRYREGGHRVQVQECLQDPKEEGDRQEKVGFRGGGEGKKTKPKSRRALKTAPEKRHAPPSFQSTSKGLTPHPFAAV